MKNFKLVSKILILSLILGSCAQSNDVVNNSIIQKRKYRKGFHFDLAKKQKKDQKAEYTTLANDNSEVKKIKLKENTTIDKNERDVITASNNEAIIVVPKKQAELSIAKDDKIVEEKVLLTDEAKAIVINSKKDAKKFVRSIVKEYKKSNKANAPNPAPASSGKSQLTALLLCIFVGGIGIHRFYLGYTWQGIVQLLTFGACGIWSLIDLIRIITGDLGPKNGSYSKTL